MTKEKQTQLDEIDNKYKVLFMADDEPIHNQCLATTTDIEFLITELKSAWAREVELVKALEFYTDKNNWDDRYIDDDTERAGDIFDIISREDVLIEEDEDGLYLSHGGNKAREALTQHKSSLEK